MKQRNERVQVTPASEQGVSLGVYAPNATAGVDPTAAAAAALGKALGVGGQFTATLAERRYQKATYAGTRAFLEGRDPTPAELKSDAFKRSFLSLQAERNLSDFGTMMSADYEKARQQPGFNVDTWFAQHSISQYGGYDMENDAEAEIAKWVTPKLEQMRAQFVGEESKRAMAEVQTKTAANVISIFDNIRAQNRVPTAKEFDDVEHQLFAIGGADLVNETFMAAAHKAAADGDVNFVNSIPATWGENNVPSIRTNAKYAGQFENALLAANNQQYTNQEHARALADREHKKMQENNAQQIVSAIINGRNMDVQIRDLVTSDKLASDTARALIEFQHVNGTRVDTGEENFSVSLPLEVAVRKGDASIDDVIKALPKLGYGNKGREAATRLMQLATTAQDDRLKTPDALGFRKILEARLKKPTDFLSSFDPSIVQQNNIVLATGLKEYDDELLKGTSAGEAAQKIGDKYAPGVRDAQTGPRTGPIDLDGIRRAIDTGAVNPQDVINQLDQQ